MFIHAWYFYPSKNPLPPLDLKGPTFYLSEEAGSDKLFNEGVLTIFNELDNLKLNLREIMKPNGTRNNPARTCYDLFLCYPSYIEGYYWIDPNLGSTDDAIEVLCQRPGCSCIDDNDESLSIITDRKDYIEVLHINRCCLL